MVQRRARKARLFLWHLTVELDDRSHQRVERQEPAKFVARVLSSEELTILHLPLQRSLQYSQTVTGYHSETARSIVPEALC